MVLMRSSEMGRYGRSSLLVEVEDAGVQNQNFLSLSWSIEAQPTSLLLSGASMEVFNQILATGRRNDLEVLQDVEHGKSPKGRSVASEFGRSRNALATLASRRACRRTPSTAPDSPTARQGPSVLMGAALTKKSRDFLPPFSIQTSSRNYWES